MIHNTIKIALTLPGGNIVSPPPDLKKDFVDLASLLSPVLNIIFYLAIFLTFYFLVWGAFQYTISQGKKENLAKARSRITWALIGLMVTLLAFFLAKFIGEAFTPKGGLPF